MNILHMKYAVEVARLGSLNKASETLFIAQPNISRSIKELEADLGITIFNRSAKGMELTAEGEEFISYAESILKQIDSVYSKYKNGTPIKKSFSLSSPRSFYIANAFSSFTKLVGEGSAELIYKETNSKRTVLNVLNDGYKLGIVRYSESYDKHFKEMFEEKGLYYETVSEFSPVLLVKRTSPLAKLENVTLSDLSKMTEIVHADPYVPAMPINEVIKRELSDTAERKIMVFERASRLEILSNNDGAFVWACSSSEEEMARYGITALKCTENKKVYKDILIYKKGYVLSELDRAFITELCNSKRRYISRT